MSWKIEKVGETVWTDTREYDCPLTEQDRNEGFRCKHPHCYKCGYASKKLRVEILEKKLEQIEKREARLVKVLEFYADSNNYCDDGRHSPLERDSGERARAILKEKKNEKRI